VVDRSSFSRVGSVFYARDAATEKAVSPIRRHAAASTIEFFYININYIMNDRLTVWATSQVMSVRGGGRMPYLNYFPASQNGGQ